MSNGECYEIERLSGLQRSFSLFGFENHWSAEDECELVVTGVRPFDDKTYYAFPKPVTVVAAAPDASHEFDVAVSGVRTLRLFQKWMEDHDDGPLATFSEPCLEEALQNLRQQGKTSLLLFVRRIPVPQLEFDVGSSSP